MSLAASLGLSSSTIGSLELLVGPTTATLPSLANNFCSLVSKEIASHLGAISAAVQKVVVDLLAKEALAVGRLLPTVFSASGKVNVTVGAATGTQVGAVALVAALQVNTLIKPSGQLGPNALRLPLPVMTGADGRYHVRLADCLFSNALWTVYEEHKLSLHFNFTAELTRWNLTMLVTAPGPSVVFNASGVSRLVLPVDVYGRAVASSAAFVTSAQWSAGLSVTLKPAAAGNYTIKLELDKTATRFDWVGPNCTGACLAVLQKLESVLPIDVALIDAILEKVSIPLPLPASLGIRNLTLATGDGFVEVAAELFAASSLPSASLLTLDSLSAIPCPAIPHAHTDKCI